jgi:hypothetical protein
MLTLLQTVALVGGTVHPMTADSEPALATVLIEDGRVTAVGPDVPVPDGAEVIDVAGLHVVPGLIDASINHDPEHDPLYTAAGVTLARDTGNELLRVLLERQRALRDRAPGPDLLVCGQVLDGAHAALANAVSLASAEEAQLKLDVLFGQLEREGHRLDFLSIMEGLPESAWRVALREAHERGMQLWGPLPAGVDIAQAGAAGQDGVFGLQVVLPAGRTWHEVRFEELAPGIQALADSGLAVAPMLAAHARVFAERAAEPPELAWLSPHYEVAWRHELETWARYGPAARSTAEAALALQRRVLVALHEEGVRLVPGSGAPNPWLLPGRALLEELDEWVLAGIPPAHVLRAATAGAAEVLGVGDERGAIAPGYVADLVVVGSDPRRSVGALRDPELVLVRGRVLEREDVDAQLQDLAARQQSVREELAALLAVDPPDVPEGEVVLSGTVESKAYGLRVSAESYAVVRLLSGATAYCARVRTPSTANEVGREVHLVQVLKDGLLQGFELSVRDLLDPDDPRRQEVSVQGKAVGESKILNIERRLNGQFIDNKRAQNAIAGLDVCPSLTALLVAHEFPEGASYVVSFEGNVLEPYTDQWKMRVRADDHQHQVMTSRGWVVFGFSADGAMLYGLREQGNAHMRYDHVGEPGGPGMPLPTQRVHVVEGDGEDR